MRLKNDIGEKIRQQQTKMMKQWKSQEWKERKGEGKQKKETRLRYQNV